MTFLDDLTAMEVAAQRKRIDARATATSIVVGLLAARMEEMHPGSRDKMLGQLEAMVEHFAANGDLSKDVVEDVARFATSLLSASNT